MSHVNCYATISISNKFATGGALELLLATVGFDHRMGYLPYSLLPGLPDTLFYLSGIGESIRPDGILIATVCHTPMIDDR